MRARDTIQHGDSGTITGQVTDVHSNETSQETAAIEIDLINGVSGWLLFESSSPGRAFEWELEQWYRIENVIGCVPEQALQTREERVKKVFSNFQRTDLLSEDLDDMTACPVCGEDTDVNDALHIESQVRDRLETLLGNVHGFGREMLSIEALGAEMDWRPQSEQRRQQRRRHRKQGNVVCLDCDQNVTEYYREQIERKRQESGPREIVDESPDNASSTTVLNSMEAEASAPTSADIGMATGGAKDATNFRDNIHDGYVPQPDSLAFEGLFYDYHFDTGDTSGGDGLFYPSYSLAVTEAPVTGDVERYMTVGLNSNLTEADLERKPLNLVAVIDVSGSMSSAFDQYYYNEHGNRKEGSDDNDSDTKMAAARQALSALTEQLRDEDQLGVVLYNSSAHVAKPLHPVGDTNMDAIRSHIQNITADGGTDMSAGSSTAMKMLEPHHGADLTDVENRIVFMTDAMPNTGTTGRDNIVDKFDAAAAEHVHTTFIGIGLDTNADLVESISGVRGANHYFIHSTDEFKQRLADEFTYMVTPLVFDLALGVVSDGYEIEAVYGSPNADEATGEVMHVTTLFPSPTTDGETRGGITLLKLTETDPDASLDLVANWTERNGTANQDSTTLTFPTQGPTYFENNGIRKAVLLSRYGRLLREWMTSVRRDDTEPSDGPIDDWTDPDAGPLGEWEKQSIPLSVTGTYQSEFEKFRQHMMSEIEQIGDETLGQDAEILSVLSELNSQTSSKNELGLTEEELERLQDIIELQPTTNSELQAEWGLNESADTHYYLEEHLSDLYYRDETDQIRAIDDAAQLFL